MITTRRFVISHACEVCRKSKKKCNGLFPCCECQRLSKDCFYSERKTKTNKKSSPTQKKKLSNIQAITSPLKELKQTQTNTNTSMQPTHIITNNLPLQQQYATINKVVVNNKGYQNKTINLNDSQNLFYGNHATVDFNFLNFFQSQISNVSDKSSEDFDIFNVSGLLFNPIDNPYPKFSFTKQFLPEETLSYFMNQQIPVNPDDSLSLALAKVPELDLTQLKNSHSIPFKLFTIYFILLSSAYSSSGIQFIEWQRLGGHSYNYKDPNYTPKNIEENKRELRLCQANDINFVFKQFNSHFEPYFFYSTMSYRCQFSLHPLLFSEFGSPQKAATLFADISYEYIKKNNFRDFFRCKAYIHVQFCYGDQRKALHILRELHELALLTNFDKSTMQNSYHFLTNPSDVYMKRLFWVGFFAFTTFISYPMIGDERMHMDMTLESEWDKFYCFQEIPPFKGDFKIHHYSQIVFLTRKAIRFFNNKENKSKIDIFSGTTSIHNELLMWFERLPEANKIFNSLKEFLVGIRNFKNLNWYKVISNIKILIWFLYSLIKIHTHHYKFNSTDVKFNFSAVEDLEEVDKLKATSLDIILCCVRALSSVLAVYPPNTILKEMKGDFHGKRFSLDSDIIEVILLILSLFEMTTTSNNDKGSWLNIFEIKKEVFIFHLKDMYLLILKRLNTSYSLKCLKEVELKLMNRLDIFEINEIYKDL
ncbi:hypothetical protein HK099_003925 [Clydaea vesicula]|uniref:Zn(2)-C6 fungal-type domain-containing protein n=1 Tax=Clydaea vesicula TaxID=447962 RepID=A0AAD5XVZ5_9FUNG|nr:hypothetical protein HK099_003925 [Clydaea vesicula]